MADARQQRIAEAREILELLGLPPAQQNDRSAFTLLALLNVGPDRPWKTAAAPLVGVHDIMEWIHEEFGFRYAENTRETIRRQTLHQFEHAALIVRNPDDPERPVNSPKNVYQVDAAVLQLLRKFNTPQWSSALRGYLDQVETLKVKYARARQRHVIDVQLAPGLTVALSAGGQNPLWVL